MSKKSVAEAKKKTAEINREAFMAELTKLSQKHGIRVGGCGCCGSPYLMDFQKGDKAGHYFLEGETDLRWSAD